MNSLLPADDECVVRQLKMTVLVENTATSPGLLCEHGLSLWIEADQERILFDMGQGAALKHNAALLGVKLATATAAALSHGHYDHSGGLPVLTQHAPDAPLYLHPDAAGSHFSLNQGPPCRAIGMTAAAQDALQAHRAVRWSAGPTRVAPGIWLTGAVPRKNAFENTGGRFFADESCTRADSIPDDQALWVRTPHGLAVFLGCAHSGVCNSLAYIQKLSGGTPIYAVVGGFHLLTPSEERLRRTLEYLFGLPNLRVLAAGHCTGPDAIHRLQSAFNSRARQCATGCILDFTRDLQES